MHDYVCLASKRNRGWPWPERSSGRDPMYGEHGWCPDCGVPKHEQTGQLTLQRRNLTVEGAWEPNWQFDAVCVAADLADQISSSFDVELRPIAWPKQAPGAAFQLMTPMTGERWFDDAELRTHAIEKYGNAGAACATCGVWRWMPLVFGFLPPVRLDEGSLAGVPIMSSPEWFGDGWMAFRQVLVRRDLAALISSASPRDFAIEEVA